MTDKTDSKERGSIISSSDILLHDAKTALLYEELRAAIDDGHESMTHADALAEIAAIRAENEKLHAELASIGAGGVSGPLMGCASIAASAGSEPVAYAMFSANGNIRLWSKARIPHPDARPLYLHPSPPEGMVGGWMPIETAPRDGKFLVRDGTWHGKVASTPKLSDVAMVERSDGGAFEVSDTDYYTAYITNPTGWMPRPPTSAEGVEHG